MIRPLLTKEARLLTWLTLTAALLWPVEASHADDVKAALTDSGWRIEASLADYQPFPGALFLRGASDDRSITIPIVKRLELDQAQLELRSVNSNALLDGRSQIRLALNDQTYAQLGLAAELPDSLTRVDLPTSIFKPGFNNLSFHTSLHYTNECEEGGAPELWTEIDTKNSALRLAARRNVTDLKMSDLSDLLSPALGGTRVWHVLAGPATDRSDLFEWGGSLAQAAGLSLGYVAPQMVLDKPKPFIGGKDKRTAGFNHDLISIDPASLKGLNSFGHDYVMIGTRDDLIPYLSASERAEIKGAYLALHPMNSDAGQYVLIVSGVTKDDVARAARSLSDYDYSYTDSTRVYLTDAADPMQAAYDLPQYLKPRQSYRFSELGYQSTTVTGGRVQDLVIPLTIPANLYAKESDTVKLSLNLAYGAGMREDSVVNIYLNDVLETAIGLDRPAGAVIRGYRLEIPLRSFKPGYNQLRFETAMISDVSGACVQRGHDNLVFSLWDTSTVDLPEAARYAELPDLSLLGRTGFPYLDYEEGDRLSLRALDPSRQSIGAAWTVLARLAQLAERPMNRVDYGFGADELTNDTVIVGVADAVPDAVRAASPLGYDAPHYVSLRFTPPEDAKNKNERGVGEFFSSATAQRRFDSVKRAVELGENGDNAVVEMFESPDAPGKTVTLVSAANPDTLERATAKLVTPQIWSQLKGNAFFWRENELVTANRLTGPRFTVGELSPFDSIGNFAGKSPWSWAVITLGILAFLAFLTHSLIGTYRRTHSPTAEE